MLQKLFSVITFSCLTLAAVAQGIEFEQGTWSEALAKAKESDKLIFVDAYAAWCGPCKRMAKNLFPLQDVGDYFNKHFINVKMDMEKGEGPALGKKYPVTAFPTLLFISPEGRLVHRQKGAPRTAAALIDIAMTANKKFDRSVSYMAKYDSGDRSYETMYGLVVGLNKSNKSSLKVANEYLRQQTDLSTEENVRFIFEAMTQLDSRIFDLFEAQYDRIRVLYSSDEIVAKMDRAAKKTIDNAVEFEFEELLSEAQAKYKKILPGNSKAFTAKSNRQYAAATKNEQLFLQNMPKKGKANQEIKQAINMALDSFKGNEKIMKECEKWAKNLVQANADAASYFLLSQVQVELNKKNQAIKSLEKCLDLTPPESKENQTYKSHLRKLRNE